MTLHQDSRGFGLVGILSFMIALAIFGGAVLTVIFTNFFVVGNSATSQQAFNIAEAGANYYLWHMSHNPTDYKDGQTTPTTPDPTLGYGPYTHDYVDDDGVTTGTYTLWINPASTGSTIATVRSIGKVNGSDITRTVEVKIGAKSFASYGLLSDSALWFGNTESADGPVLSNVGIRMDGANSDTVYSANATYVPPSSLGGNGSTSRPGVWCSTSVTSPINCNTRDKSNWIYPTSSVDFTQVSGSLCTMKKVAFADDASTAANATAGNACTLTPNTRTSAYVPQRSSTFSSSRGYLVQLNSNDTYNLYNVSAHDDRQTPYTSALTYTTVATNISLPPSGVIFVEDNVWVRTNGNFDDRVTIAAGRLASSSYTADIGIADDVTYAYKNGTNAIGMVAEGNIYIEPYAPPATGNFNFEVDAALLAQSGSVIYPGKYASSSSRNTRGWVGANQTFTFYGSVASRQTWTWTWLTGCSGDAVYDSSSGYCISGILHNTTSYDYNLLYAPPPSYPVTGGYQILSWREVLTKP